MPFLGIDFGTSNSVVANYTFGRAEVVPNQEGRPTTPSVVTLRRDNSLAFGTEARENFDESRSIRSVKRALGGPDRVELLGQTVRPEQVAAMLFGLLKRDAEAHLKETVAKAVVTIPANSKGLARHATKSAAQAAGLQVLALINEPTAAAICYGLNARDEQTVLVYDFGGGTLDVTVLRLHHGMFEEIASKGIGKLGGDDLDLALGNVIAERFRQKTGYDILNSPYRQPFLLAVERAKIELSTQAVAVACAPLLVPDKQLSLEEEIDRETLERAVTDLVVKSGEAIDSALALRDLRPRDIDRILLVGGTSKMPLVRRFVTEKLGGREPEPFDKADPMTCIAQGAAIVSAMMQNAPGLESLTYSVKLEHSLCANPVDDSNREYLDPIIKRGTDIPCSYTKIYYPVSDPADKVLISVYEGDDYRNPAGEENVKMAEIAWEFDPPRPQRDAALEVTYEYADDGILTVQIHDTRAGRRQRFPVQAAGASAVTAPQVAKMAKVNDDLLRRTEQLESTPAWRDAQEVLKKTETAVLPKIDDATDRRELEDLCREVRRAMASGDPAAVETAAGVLSERLLNYAWLL